MATKKKTTRKKPQAPSAKKKPVKKSIVSKKAKTTPPARKPKVKKIAKKTAKKTTKAPVKVKPVAKKKTPVKKVKKSKPVKFRSIKTKVVKKTTKKKTRRIIPELRSIEEKLYAPQIGEILESRGNAYRYRITKIDGEKIITRSKKLFESLLNDEMQKQKEIVESIKKKYKKTGTYGRIYPETKRNETKEGRITSINVDFSKNPNLDIFRKYYNEFKDEYLF